jgi:hypothetical protein
MWERIDPEIKNITITDQSLNSLLGWRSYPLPVMAAAQAQPSGCPRRTPEHCIPAA